jgi:hypothetical protein
MGSHWPCVEPDPLLFPFSKRTSLPKSDNHFLGTPQKGPTLLAVAVRNTVAITFALTSTITLKCRPAFV